MRSAGLGPVASAAAVPLPRQIFRYTFRLTVVTDAPIC
jgi:hypothetical protein